MVCSPPRTPLLVLNIVVGVTAFALATVLANKGDNEDFYRNQQSYDKLPAIIVAYITTALSVAYYTGRLFVRCSRCSRIINCCSAAHATRLGLAGDVAMGMAVSTAAMLAVLYPKVGPESKRSLQSGGVNMYHALQALLCLLCLSSVLTVWASVNAPREASWGTTFDDTTSQGTAAAATSQGTSAAATTSQGTATTTIVLQKKRFTNAQTGLHVALWTAATLALILLAVAVSTEYEEHGSTSGYYYYFTYSPYNTAEVVFSLAVVCLVWLVSTVYICLRVCSVAVHPIAVLAADVVFLVLTMVSAGVANALGGVNCSGFTTCNIFIAGVAFIWLSMVAYIVLLVLNVLAVVQTTAMNIQQVNFISQGQGHNIEVVVGGGDGTNGDGTTGSTNSRSGSTENELRGPDAAPVHAPPIVSGATPAKLTPAQCGLHVVLWLLSILSLSLLARAYSAEVYAYYDNGYYGSYGFNVRPYMTGYVAASLAFSCVLAVAYSGYLVVMCCRVSVNPKMQVPADIFFLVLNMVSATLAIARGGVDCSNDIDGICAAMASAVAFLWLMMVFQIVLLVLDVMALKGLLRATVTWTTKPLNGPQIGLNACVWLTSLLALGLLSSAVAWGGYYDDYYGYYNEQYEKPEVVTLLAVVCMVWVAATIHICLGACKVAVRPVAVLSAGVFFFFLTIVAVPLAFSIGVFSTSDSLSAKFASGMSFSWLMMASQIGLLVFNVLAAVGAPSTLLASGMAAPAPPQEDAGIGMSSFTEVSSSAQYAVATPMYPPMATLMTGNDEHPNAKDF